MSGPSGFCDVRSLRTNNGYLDQLHKKCPSLASESYFKNFYQLHQLLKITNSGTLVTLLKYDNGGYVAHKFQIQSQ
jgi:hypothetical protein